MWQKLNFFRMRKILFILIAACISCIGSVDYLKMAIVAHQQGFYSLSNQQIKKYIEENPSGENLDYAYLLYSSNLIKLGNYNQAIEKLKILIEKFPKSEYLKDAYTYLILSYLKIDDIKSSLENYSLYKKKWGVDNFIENQIAGKIFEKGYKYYLKRKYKEGKKFFNLIVENIKDGYFKKLSFYYTGLIYYQKNSFEKAKESFEKAKDIKDKKIKQDIYLKIGDCYFNLRKFNEAEKYYREVKKNWPESISSKWAEFQLALIEKRKGNLNKAKEILKNIQTDEKNLKIKILFTLSTINMLMQDWKEARENLIEIIKNFPEYRDISEIYMRIGFVYFNEKNFEKAIEYFRKVLQLKPEEKIKERTYFGLGYTFYIKGDFKKATDIWRKLEIEFPASSFLPQVLFLKGKKYFMEKNYEKGEKNFKKLIDEFPSSPFSEISYPVLIETLIERKKLKEGKFYCEKYLKNKKDEKIEFLYGKILFSLGEIEKSRKVFENLKAKNPEIKVASRYYLGQIYEKTGKMEKAKEKYLEIISFFPQFKKWNKLAEEKLKKLTK